MSSHSPEGPERFFPQFCQEGNKLDLSGQRLNKVPKHARPSQQPKITQLLLDNNAITRLDNLSLYSSVIEFSASHNDLYKMMQVSNLKHLVRLDLSYNGIIQIEGLRELVHLSYLNLSNNKLKLIDQLQTNLQLEHLDLSHNSISAITNIHQLTKLKELYLHKNNISQLRHCGVYLPRSLECLTLAGNKIMDLNEVSHLTGMGYLKEISIASNPCVEMTGNEPGFDYRPFLINWCEDLKIIDGFAVDDIENLKGEWLYSQGRGRQFRPGQHAELVQYLIETCSLNSQNLQTDNERKLRLILSKAHHHQSQLRKEDPMAVGASKSLMTQSLDPSLLDSCSTQIAGPRSKKGQNDAILTRSLHYEAIPTKEDEPSSAYAAAPLPAASKLVPVPESLISPMVTCTPPLVGHSTPSTSTADTLSASKLQTIKSAAEKKKVKRSLNDREQAAICIQKMWRGYRTRNFNHKVVKMHYTMHIKRTNEYIRQLTHEMEATRTALENEHRLHLLQMQAINALWRKVVSLEPAKLDEGMVEVKDLAQTCERLNAQVVQLESCMKEVLRCVSPSSGNATATQTDIVAVHTPAQETIESSFLHSRPSTLPIPIQQLAQQFSECLVAIDELAETIEESVANDNNEEEVQDANSSGSQPE